MGTDLNIRPCGPDDGAHLALIGQATFLETFAGILDGEDIVAHCAQAHSIDLYRMWLTDPKYALWLVETSLGNAPVGFMAVAPPQLPIPDTDADLELKRIYLLSKFQGTGIGKKLISVALTHSIAAGAKRLLLGVYAHNQAAIGFYERTGFRRLGVRKFNVGGKDYDDIIMGMPVNT